MPATRPSRPALSLLLAIALAVAAPPLAAQDEATTEPAPQAPTEEVAPAPLAELREAAAAMDEPALQAELEAAEAAFAAELAARDAAYDALVDADEADRSARQTEYDAASDTFDRAADVLQVYVNALDDRGVDMTELRTRLIEARGIDAENLSTGAVLGLFDKWIGQSKTWLTENGPSLIFKAALFLLILFAFRLLGSIAARIVSKALGSSRLKVSSLLNEFAIGMTKKIFFVLGVLVALSSIGISVGPMLAGVGVLGFVVGFALQDTLANFASGIMLLLYRPFDVGDLIKAGGEVGRVEAMSMVSTSILTLDHQLVIVPNNTIWGSTITNVTAKPIRRVDMMFGIGYGEDIPTAEKVIEEVVAANELVLKDPETVVRVHNLGDSSVDFVVRPWCKTDDYWEVFWSVTRAIKLRLDEEGISIPFPQRDVHLFPADAPPAEMKTPA